MSLVDRLRERFGDAVTGVNLEAVDPWIEVAPDALVDVCLYLRDQSDLHFTHLSCITGVDYFEPDPKKASKTAWDPHLEVVYHLWSYDNKCSLVLKVMLPRWRDDATPEAGALGELPQVPSVCCVWSGADWHEREVYDLTGVDFVGHPGLRRILCPEDWVGYPLRKDYEMPLDYHGIRAR